MIIRMRKYALDAENLEEYLKVFNFKKESTRNVWKESKEIILEKS